MRWAAVSHARPRAPQRHEQKDGRTHSHTLAAESTTQGQLVGSSEPVRRFAQGHLCTQLGGARDRTSNLPVINQPALSQVDPMQCCNNIMSEWSTEAALPSLYVADPAHGTPRATEGGPHAVPPVFGGRGWGSFSYLSMVVQKHLFTVNTGNDVENAKNEPEMY